MTLHSRLLPCAAALALCALPAAAREPGVPSNVPPGNTMGVAVGANPPPGFYIGVRSGYWDTRLKDRNGDYGGQKNTLADTAIQFIWVSDTPVLGATWRAFATVPLIYNDQSREAPFAPPQAWGKDSKSGVGNIEISPVNLSWQIEPGIFVSAGLSIFAPTGGFEVNDAVNTVGDFWTISPSVGYSYLRDGWNLSMGLSYFANTESGDTSYRSGDEVLFNFTALKDVGGWSIGPVGYWRKQITEDENNGTAYGGTVQGKAEQAGLGLGVTTHIGGLETNINLTRDVYIRNTVGGTKLWVNVLVPFGKG